jgi:lambda family phage portal protein
MQTLTAEQRWARSQALIRLSGSPTLNQWMAESSPSARRATARAAAQHGAQGATWRAYAGAKWGASTADWVAQATSADSELYTSLRTLRNRSRQLVRDNEYAKNAKRIVVNNVIGTGIGFEAQVMQRNGKALNTRVNDRIETEWRRWCKATLCHTAGRLSFKAMQRFILGNVFEAGEILIRLVHQPFGGSSVPLALEVIEADQIVDNYSGKADNGNTIRMGVEVDQWQRPVAYWLHPKHPGDYSFHGSYQPGQYLRVPANEIIHLGLFERPYQTRCVPWLHATLIKLRHMGGYEEAEIIAARAAASIMGFRQKPELDLPDPEDDEGQDEDAPVSPTISFMPGQILELPPGETFNGFSPSRPNAALDPFMRFMLRSVAAGVGVSYESLSRDYSQSNYSSSRLALLDDRDGWRILQDWFTEAFLVPVFERWLDLAVLSGTLPLQGYEADPDAYRAVEWQPRGWSWIDPAKEQAAAKSAVRSGHSTLTDDLAEQGKSIEAIFKRRRRELDLAKEYDLVLDTDPAQLNDKGAAQATPAPGDPSPKPDGDDAGEGAKVGQGQAPPDDGPADDKDD